jgi:hypothetical protein
MTTGPVDYKILDPPEDQWTTGLVEHMATGTVDYKTSGPQD